MAINLNSLFKTIAFALCTLIVSLNYQYVNAASGGVITPTVTPVVTPVITPVLVSNATLKIVEGSGEFQTLETEITVTDQEALYLQWTTDQAGATGGDWKVINAGDGNKEVAGGTVNTAPASGHFDRFTIPSNAFLHAPAPAGAIKFKISITPHDASNKPLGIGSNLVTVNQVPDTSTPIVFDDSAVFPVVELVSFDEKIGVVPQTQLHYAGADVTLRVSNPGSTDTSPIRLMLKDNGLLMRQNSPALTIAAIKKGAQSKTYTIHLDAILPPPESQLPEAVQYSKWNQDYLARCMELRVLLDWNGPVAQSPINDHQDLALYQEGFGDYAKTTPTSQICDGNQCITACNIAKNIRNDLNGHSVGYAFFAGQYPLFGAHGEARTSANAPGKSFTPDTKITVASVSKFVTTVAAIRILSKNGVSLDAAIGPYLPSDWSNASSYVKNIKFSQLLGQMSGIKDYGNVSQDYAKLKSYFTQSVSNNPGTSCTGPSVVNPGNSINPKDLTWCYSNYNFAIFRILLPKVAGFAEDSNPATRPATLANQYVKLVQQNVFDLVGQKNVECKPPSSAPASTKYAFAYLYPGTKAGTDFGDVSLVCGAAGWYLSVQDMSKVLLSLNANDGKILTKAQFDTLRTRALGVDVRNDNEIEKNGGWGANCDSQGNNCDNISTSVAIFGPVKGPRVIGVLFINSDIAGGGSSGAGAQQVLEKAYFNALTTTNNLADWERIMNWTESVYPGLFVKYNKQDLTVTPYNVRYYPDTHTYLGYNPTDGHFYGYNSALWGSSIIKFGTVADYLYQAKQAGF